MPERPRLSLCIPTYNRGRFLEGAVSSGLREAATLPAGTVEVLVCDNASTDGTRELLARIGAEHPGLRCYRNEENLGFDLNYLRCIEEARGDFVWIVGDDDVWMPGAAARVLRELAAGADACLCLAEACDHDLKPLVTLPWYLDKDPPGVWHLEGREDLIRYFQACARNAAAFAFISVGVFRRDRFLEKRESSLRAVGLGYLHLWGMMEYLRRPLTLHYIPEALIRNRLSDAHDGTFASRNLFGRWMQDLYAWEQVAEGVLADDPELAEAFFHVLGRNHHNTILPGMREHASSDEEWQGAVPYLQRAGFSPQRVAAVDLAHRIRTGRRLVMPSLDRNALCLGDLKLLARGARRIAVLAFGELPEAGDMLQALRQRNPDARIVLYGTPGPTDLPEGMEIRPLEDPDGCGKGSLGDISGFGPELVLNLDPSRSERYDLLMAAGRPAGGVAFQTPPDSGRRTSDDLYTRLFPLTGGAEAMGEALGLAAPAPAEE